MTFFNTFLHYPLLITAIPILFYLLLISSIIFLIFIIKKYIKSIPQELTLKTFISANSTLTCLQATSLFLLFLTGFFIFIPTPMIISPQIPLFESVDVTLEQPFSITFDRPISRQIIPDLYPQVQGEWSFSSHKFLPPLVDTLTFIPQHNLSPNLEYTINLSQILPVSWISLDQADKTLFVFHTPGIPDIKQINPADKAEEINPKQPIHIALTHQNPTGVKWSYQINPGIINQFQLNSNQDSLTISPQHPLNQATTYELDVFRQTYIKDFTNQEIIQTGDKQLVSSSSFTTASFAAIDQIQPIGQQVLPSQPIKINFQQSMNQKLTQNAFSIHPSTPGMFSWQAGNRLTFTPQQPWQLDTSYTLKIASSAQTQAGGELSQEVSHQFSTIGEVEIQSSQPSHQSINHPVSDPIRIEFNQPVSTSQVSSILDIKPEISGKKTWDQNTLIFSPSTNFNHNTQYQIKFPPGIKALHGQDSTQELKLNFTTIPGRFELEIPSYKQHHTFTCYSAATQMALAYRGITSINEVQFLSEIGFDPTPRNFTTNTWGDPNQGVVGTYDGSGPGGYGAHWQPVADAISKHRPVEVKRNWSIPQLLGQVSQGNPVMVWWVNGVWPAKDVSWNLPSGEKVYTVNGMHVEVVRGFIGDINHPEYILTNDPWRGQRQYTPEQFQNLWKWFSNTAIIVR